MMRMFTQQEDELIKAQARGEIVMWNLLATLRTSKEAVMRRAHELGVVPKIRPKRCEKNFRIRQESRSRPTRDEIPNEFYAEVDKYRIVNDKLLKRLRKLHSERAA